MVNLGIFEDRSEPESTRKIKASSLPRVPAKNRDENIVFTAEIFAYQYVEFERGGHFSSAFLSSLKARKDILKRSK